MKILWKIIKFLITTVLIVVVLLGLLIGGLTAYWAYKENQFNKYNGHGFQYMHGYSSTDFKGYHVYDGEKLIGASSDRMLSAKTREMISICTIDEDYAVEGKAVEVLWGNPGTCQMRIRAEVTLFPYIKEDRNDNIDIEKIPRPVFD